MSIVAFSASVHQMDEAAEVPQGRRAACQVVGRTDEMDRDEAESSVESVANSKLSPRILTARI
jgi:hypothetical protein